MPPKKAVAKKGAYMSNKKRPQPADEEDEEQEMGGRYVAPKVTLDALIQAFSSKDRADASREAIEREFCDTEHVLSSLNSAEQSNAKEVKDVKMHVSQMSHCEGVHPCGIQPACISHVLVCRPGQASVPRAPQQRHCPAEAGQGCTSRCCCPNTGITGRSDLC